MCHMHRASYIAAYSDPATSHKCGHRHGAPGPHSHGKNVPPALRHPSRHGSHPQARQWRLLRVWPTARCDDEQGGAAPGKGGKRMLWDHFPNHTTQHFGFTAEQREEACLCGGADDAADRALHVIGTPRVHEHDLAPSALQLGALRGR